MSAGQIRLKKIRRGPVSRCENNTDNKNLLEWQEKAVTSWEYSSNAHLRDGTS